MKRFLLFTIYEDSSDAVGWDTFEGEYDTLEEIEQERLMTLKSENREPWDLDKDDSYQVVDTQTKKKVEFSDGEVYDYWWNNMTEAVYKRK